MEEDDISLTDMVRKIDNGPALIEKWLLMSDKQCPHKFKGCCGKGRTVWGTYAYKDIVFEFACWVSPQFKLYLTKEFERLKKEEQALLG